MLRVLARLVLFFPGLTFPHLAAPQSSVNLVMGTDIVVLMSRLDWPREQRYLAAKLGGPAAS